MSDHREARFIAAVLKDGEGERWQACRHLSPEAFHEPANRDAWREIVKAVSYTEAATGRLARAYFIHETAGEEYLGDRDAMWIEWLRKRGLEFEADWRETLPVTRSSGRLPKFETEPDEEEVLKTVEPIVDGLLEPGDKMSISSGSKSFKTWTLIQLAYAIQTGEPWLGFRTRKTRVLFLNFEIKPRNFWKRVYAVRGALGLEKSGPFTAWNLRGTGFSMDSDAEELIRRAKQGRYGVIVLDPVYKLFGERNESSAGDMASLMALFDKVATQTSAAIIYGHHFAKGSAAGKDAVDRQSGSGVFARDPDCLVSLTRLDESQSTTGFAVDVTLRDFPPIDRFAVRREHPLMIRDASLNPHALHEPRRRSKYSAKAFAQILPTAGATMKEWTALAKAQLGASRSRFYDYADAAKQLARCEGERWFLKEDIDAA